MNMRENAGEIAYNDEGVQVLSTPTRPLTAPTAWRAVRHG
jgi:hypothetical protein